MRADKIIELGLRKCVAARELGIKALSVPVFDFGMFDYPDFRGLQEDSILCWNEGLLKFPYDECCFVHGYTYTDRAGQQFTNSRSIYQVGVNGDGSVIITEWRYFDHDAHGPRGVAPAITCKVFVNPTRPTQWTVEWQPTPWTPQDMVDAITEYFSVGNRISEFIDPVMAMAMYLNTSGVVSERFPAAAALNKSRIKKGKLPIPERHVVRICPSILGKSGESAGGGHHKGPRPHYRRGHVRRLDEDRKTWVKACIVAGSVHDAEVPTYKVVK